MSTSADALKIVQSLVKRTRSARVGYGALVAYAEKYLARSADVDKSLEDFADNPSNLMAAYLVDLEKQGRVSLTYVDGAISSVSYPEYYHALITSLYDALENSPERPFPSEDSLSVTIPADAVTPVDVKSDFVRWLARTETASGPHLLRLMFPEGIHSMVVTTDLLAHRIPKLAVHRFRQYLRSERNAGYIRSKLASIFRTREMAMKDMLASILTTPDQALKSIVEPTDFTFSFWTQLSTTIIKEYSQKKDKLLEEHGYCQAAYLIGYYNVHHRGELQRARERESALRQLDVNMHKPPYTYTISQIHSFTDGKGTPLTRRYPLEDANRFIADRIRPGEGRSLPQMIRIKTADGGEYYVFREFVLTVVIDRVFQARREFRDHYMDEWSEAIRRNSRTPVMTDDLAFDRAVEERLKTEDSLLHALLNYNLLFLTKGEMVLTADVSAEMDGIFHPHEPRLRSFPEVLNLNRKTLLSDVRLLLPFWQAVPFLNALVTFLKRVFIGLPAEERVARRERRAAKPRVEGTTARYAPDGIASDGAPPPTGSAPGGSDGPVALAGLAGSRATGRKAQAVRFREAARNLAARYIHPGSTAEATLQELAERWNPVLDPVAGRNLVEDVNSLTRDFLRRMKVTFRLIPPTRQRVEEWANRLSENEAFAQIRRTEDLKEYLKLYMLTVLGK